MTLKRKLQERIKGINELQERFSPTSTVYKALEPIKTEYKVELEKEIKRKQVKVKVATKKKG